MGLATAQNSMSGSLSHKSGPDPVKAATKPVTPKSAMSGQRKSAPVQMKAANQNTNSELSRLERGQAAGVAPRNAATPKAPPLKSADQSSKQSPAINYKYQKPAAKGSLH
jgi:hypothetical protein